MGIAAASCAAVKSRCFPRLGATSYHAMDGCRESLQLLFGSRTKRVEGANIPKIKKKFASRKGVGQAQRNDEASRIESVRHFSLHMNRRAGVL